MSKLINKLTIIFILFLILLLNLFIIHQLLPQKYFYDSNTIRNFIEFSEKILPLNSYNNIAFFYKKLGFNSNTKLFYAGIFTFSLAYFITILSLFFGKVKFNIKFLIIFSIWSFLMVIYLGQYSKEISVVILTFILLYFAKYNNNKIFIPILITILSLYAYYFRIYWIIILYFILVFYFFNTVKGRSKLLLIFLSILLIFIVANYKGVFLTDARTNVNINRIDSSDAQTIILNLLENRNFITDFLNSVVAFIQLLVPVTILIKLKIKYIVFTLWELLNIFLFARASLFFIKHKFYLPISLWRRVKFSIFLIISFTLTQSLFEPDYGSFLKHQIGIIPTYLFLITNYFYFYKKLRGSILYEYYSHS
jgi:hypothetical protein